MLEKKIRKTVDINSIIIYVTEKKKLYLRAM